MQLTRVAILLVVALAVFLLALSVENVGPNEVALVGGGAGIRELAPGIHIVTPFKKVRHFKLSQTHRLRGDNSLDVRDPSGRSTRVEADVELALAREKVRDLDLDYGEAIFDKIVKPTLLVELAAAFAAEGGPAAATEQLGARVAERTNARLEPLGIRVVSVTLTGILEGRPVSYELKRRDGVKVFILGFDAYDWIIMERVADSVDLANMRRVRREGAWGNLQSIEPLVSPLIWTTMVTGVTPDIHGITDFLVRDDLSGQDIPVTSSMRRVPALWNMTSLTDLSCGFIGWFASFPAEEVRGFIVSDRFGYHMFDPRWVEGEERPTDRGLTFPASLYAEIDPLTVTAAEVGGDLSRYINGPIRPYETPGESQGGPRTKGPPDPESSLRQIISAYRTYEGVMKKVYPAYGPDLFGVYFEFTDSVCHLFMRCMKPAMEGVSADEEHRYGGAIAATYAEADRILGEVLDMIDDETVLLICSDHGFKSGDFRPLSDSRMGFGQAIEWHRLNGSVAFYGSIVKPGHEIVDASVLDIAPTVLYLLGMPVDRKMPGKVLFDAFKEEWVEEHPIEYTSVYDSLVAPADVAVGPSPADQALKDKLVSLGYVAGGQNSLVNLANYYLKNGKYDEALKLYKQLLDEDPGNADVKVGLSTVYAKLGKYDLAVQSLEEVLAKAPANLEALQSLGNIYVELGDGQQALRVAERALALDAGDGESHFIKGIALQKLGRMSEAAEVYRRALKLAPDMPEIYGNLAMIYVSEGRGDEALDLVDKALELAPGRADMIYIKGLALDAGGRPREALAQYRKAMGPDPVYVPACLGAGAIFFARGEFDSVLAICGKALSVPSSYAAHVYDLRASTYARLGRYGSAIDDFKSALAADPTLEGPRLNLAKIYIYEGKKREAAEELRSLLARYPNHAEATQLLRSLGSDLGG
jgi:tetratricopeptide (TPR) repeat protein